MTALINMPRAAWKRQPQGSVAIDRHHDAASCLVYAAVGGPSRNIVTGEKESVFGSIVTTVNAAGYAAYNNSGENYIGFPTVALTNFSILAVAQSRSLSTYQQIFADDNQVVLRIFQFRTTDSAQLQFIRFHGGGVASATSSATLSAGVPYSAMAWSTATECGAMLKDSLATAEIYSPVAFTSSSNTNWFVRVDNFTNREISTADLMLRCVFSSALSLPLRQSLVENPWQLFTSVPSRLYLIPSSGGVITLIVQKATHGHTVESPSLTQAHVLALADSLHGHTVESPLLSQAYALTLAAAAHAHTVEAPGLTQAHSLSVAEASHNHSAGNVSLFQAHILNLSDALHGHSAEAPTLTMAGSLLVADANHPHTVDAPALTQAHTITAQDAAHGHSVDALTLTQAYVLAPADATHGHLVEAPTLSTELNLLVADALHSHTVEAPGLTQAHVLSLADSLHAHTVESVAMGQGFVLLVADASHGHSAESPMVSVAFVLAIQDALHSQAADQLALATHVTLIVSDTLHTHLAGTASEIILPTGDRIFLVATEDRLFLIATEDRLFGV